MLDRNGDIHRADIVTNRRNFCIENAVKYEDVVYQEIVYGDDQTYETLKEVGKENANQYQRSVKADGLFTSEVGVGLFLPVADCVATVVYDPERRYLALLHLGRHSTLTHLVAKTVNHFIQKGSQASDLQVWMSPSAKRDTYKLQWFDAADEASWKNYCETTADGVCIDLPGYNRQQFIDLAVPAVNITISPIDTTIDANYFSHRAGDTTDRIAVLAMMR